MKRILRSTALFLVAVLPIGCSESLSPTRPGANVSQGDPAASAAREVRSAAREVPFNGKLRGTVTLDFTNFPSVGVAIAATSQATHLGSFTLAIPHLVDFEAATGAGTYEFVAANGDTLTAAFTGEADTTTSTFAIREVATITGGTGRFDGASGSFTAERLYDTVAGTTTGSFEGTISIPRGAGH